VAFSTSAQSCEAERERSRICVAPRDWRWLKCFAEAVVRIGEKPESLANWIAA